MATLTLDRSRPALLLTGATGHIGSSWLPLLRHRYPHHQLILLLRTQADLSRFSTDGTLALAGDLTRKNLGLAPAVYAQLTCSLQQIIHCAANVRFSAPLDESRAINLEGTRRLLDLAARSRSFEKFAHLSTLYVVGDRSGEIAEEPAAPGRFLSAYQQSKFEAEQLVLGAGRHVPSAIYRLSTSIGDSKTGHVRQFNYFHQLLRLALSNQLPVIPAHENAPIDLVTSDWAVSVLDCLFAKHFTPGQILHVCAGPEQSLTAPQLIDFTFNFLEQHPATGFNRRWRRPQPVGLSEFSRYAARFLNSGSCRKLWQSLAYFLPHLAIPQAFQNTKSLALLAGQNFAAPPICQSLLKVFAYCVETDWGHRLQPSGLSPKNLLHNAFPGSVQDSELYPMGNCTSHLESEREA